MSLRERLRDIVPSDMSTQAEFDADTRTLDQAADALDVLVALKPRLLDVYVLQGDPWDKDHSPSQATLRDLLALIDQVER